MDEDELREEVERILEEERQLKHKRKTHHLRWRGKLPHPFSILMGLILLLLIIMMVVPWYGITLDPEPKHIPGKEVLPLKILDLVNKSESLSSEMKVNYKRLMMPDHPALRLMASRIATQSCESEKICHSKAIFYWVRDNFQYVGDPPTGYLEDPFETMYMGGGDCDSLAILLANLEQAIGVNTRLAFIPGHVYVQVWIEHAPRKYKEKDGWITLDPTCRTCDFGEIPYSTWNKENKDYLYV